MAQNGDDRYRELLEFLSQVEGCINRISVESERQLVDTEDLLLEAEALLQDVSIVSDILCLEDGEPLVKAIADIYLWLEVKHRDESSRRPGRP